MAATVAACSAGGGSSTDEGRGASAGPTEASGSSTPSPSSPPSDPSDRSATVEPAPPPLRGIDASHHQGAIDWRAVARDGIAFAYLKASEGSTFVDPAFAASRDAATAAGLRVGGYHYLSVCAPLGTTGVEQGEHFVDVLEDAAPRGTTSLPPAVDVELGDCATPLPRADVVREVGDLIDVVERATGQDVVVYAYPDVEERYRLSSAIDRRQWVRRLGDDPPERDWWMWQRSDSATVAGVTGPVDLNLLRPPAR